MLFILLLYRLGNAVPVPYVDLGKLSAYFDTLQNTVWAFTTSCRQRLLASIFALSIQPYINASIIIQLDHRNTGLGAPPRAARGRKTRKITRYSHPCRGIIQGFGYYILIKNGGMLAANGIGIWPAIVIIASFTAAAAC